MHMMMRRPMRFIPGDLILERDTFGIEISSTLREQVRACLGERQVGARRVHRDVAVIDRGSDCRHVLVNVAAGAEELLVDRAYLEPSGVARLHHARDREQLTDCSIKFGERPIFLVFHGARARRFKRCASSRSDIRWPRDPEGWPWRYECFDPARSIHSPGSDSRRLRGT